MTGIPKSPIEMLEACLPALRATKLSSGLGDEFDVALPVSLSDGRCPVYLLHVSVTGQSASAKEVMPTLLPSFCPERHINVDGTFCLYWRAADDIAINGPASALAWWETVVRFLQLQTRAARRRRWPDGRARAHGEAAVHQFRAEQAAERLGDPLSKDMQDGRLSVAMRGSGAEGPAIRVLRDGQRIYATWLRSRRVVNLRRPCLCPAGRGPRPQLIRSCGDHADAAAALALELHRMGEQERRFWKLFEEHTCCGTMDDCPLAQTSTIAATSSHPQASLVRKKKWLV